MIAKYHFQIIENDIITDMSKEQITRYWGVIPDRDTLDYNVQLIRNWVNEGWTITFELVGDEGMQMYLIWNVDNDD